MQMADTLPTVWPAEPHTLAKHAILLRYLQAWLPILTRQGALHRQGSTNQGQREILFIDAFAGPGEYTSGEPGSPVLALQAALDHSLFFPIPVRLRFVEQRQDRFENLRQVLAPHLARAAGSQNIRAVEPRCGDCDAVLNAMLDECEQKRIAFGPALALFDQFGYGAVSMDLIRRILCYGQCEVFTYLDYKDMNRWITDESKWPAFTRAYGGPEWQACVNLPQQKRRTGLLEAYKDALRNPKRANARYVTAFMMFDKKGQPLYWLLFCTNHLRGLEEMKKAMWAVDKSGSFRFSDSEAPGQLKLLDDSFDQIWLSEQLTEKLVGRTMTVAEIKEYVLVETPCYLFKPALKSLESSKSKPLKILKRPPERTPGTYPDEKLDDIVVEFQRSLFDF
jgi:three-Cys-motif partner protein